MRIGITFDVKGVASSDGAWKPDDHEEEFDSPETIEAIAGVLRDLGHDVVLLGDGRPMLERVLADPPDFVFNFAEGHGISRTREARVPAVLEMLGIPYSGSDPLTMATTLDKDCAKRLVAGHGVAVPQGVLVGFQDDARKLARRLPFPAIVKPAWEGSSKGIRATSLVQSVNELQEVVDSLRRDHAQPILVEEFIQGDEVTVGMIGNDPPEILAIMGVRPKVATAHFVYGLEVKRDFRRLVDYDVPAKLSSDDLLAVEKAARTAFGALGCRDVARIDFRVCHGIAYFLEVNPLPGLKPKDSDLVIMAELTGRTYHQLVESILTAALDRQRSSLAPTLVLQPGVG